MMKPFLVLPLVAAIAACGGSGDSEAILVIEPADAELLIKDGVPATQAFTVTLRAPDGAVRDVTDDVTFHIDGRFGAFNANTVSVIAAGQTEALAMLDNETANATLRIRLESIRVDPSLPPNTPEWFAGPDDPSRAPTFAYPADRVVVPRNLGDFEAHWTDPSSNDVFELALQTEFSDVRIYVPGGNGLLPAGPNASWAAFLPAEWAAAVAFEPEVTYRVRGVDSSNPSGVGSSIQQLATITNEDMEGGLYYWGAGATEGGSYGIFRHDMAKPGEPAEEFLTTTQTSGRCVACHVLSRDGTKMAITYDGGSGNANIVDVGTSSMQAEKYRWNFGTFTPDGTQFLTVLNGSLEVRDANDQTVLATMDGAYATHPDLSPDGTRLVYVRPGTANPLDYSFGAGSIVTRSYDQATRTFGPETMLIASANNENNYYPSWSPDGQWIVFNRTVGASYNNVNASVWIIKADGSQAAIQLAAANTATGLTNSWARWAPFAQTTGNGEPMFWITVSSKRDFGVRLENTGLAETEKFPQLWMWAFYPDRAASGDPSAPAFRLPFQSLTTRNHIAQWTERVVLTL
ncbi:MAG: TolB family protein [Kofleriaceae bacterium]